MHWGVFIGRFQPFHRAHLETILTALSKMDACVILVGSAYRAPSARNPFNFELRREMILSTLKAWDETHGTQTVSRIKIEPIEDRYYNEALWNQTVYDAVHKHTEDAEVSIIGHEKDASSYYLRAFPKWHWLALENIDDIDATAIRQAWFEGEAFDTHCSLPVSQMLTQFRSTADFTWLKAEYDAIKAYKIMWGKTPFPVLFVTVDAFVTCCDHVLMIQRKNAPGQGLWAFPGGFLDEPEWIKTGIIRELIEETQIDCTIKNLEAHLSEVKCYDHPQRGNIGRTITHLGVIHLPFNHCPKVQADDDALAAKWVPFDQLKALKTQCHDDHYLILEHLFDYSHHVI